MVLSLIVYTRECCQCSDLVYHRTWRRDYCRVSRNLAADCQTGHYHSTNFRLICFPVSKKIERQLFERKECCWKQRAPARTQQISPRNRCRYLPSGRRFWIGRQQKQRKRGLRPHSNWWCWYSLDITSRERSRYRAQCRLGRTKLMQDQSNYTDYMVNLQ